MRPFLKLLITFSLSAFLANTATAQSLQNPNPFTFSAPGYEKFNTNPLMSNGIIFYKGQYGTSVLVDGFVVFNPALYSEHNKYSIFNSSLLSWDIKSSEITDKLIDGKFAPFGSNNQLNFLTHDVNTKKGYSNFEFNTFTGITSIPKAARKHTVNNISYEKGFGKFGYRVSVNGGYDRENEFPHGAKRIGVNLKMRYSPSDKLDIQLFSDFTNFNSINTKKGGDPNLLSNHSFSYLTIGYKPIENLNIKLKGSYNYTKEELPYYIFQGITGTAIIGNIGNPLFRNIYLPAYKIYNSKQNSLYSGISTDYSIKIAELNLRLSGGLDYNINNECYKTLTTQVDSSFNSTKGYFGVEAKYKKLEISYFGNISKVFDVSVFDYQTSINHFNDLKDNDYINNYNIGVSFGKKLLAGYRMDKFYTSGFGEIMLSMKALDHIYLSFNMSKYFNNNPTDINYRSEQYRNYLDQNINFSAKYSGINFHNIKGSFGAWINSTKHNTEVQYIFCLQNPSSVRNKYSELKDCSFGFDFSANYKNLNLSFELSGKNGNRYPYFDFKPWYEIGENDIITYLSYNSQSCNDFNLSKVNISYDFKLKNRLIKTISVGISYDLVRDYQYNTLGALNSRNLDIANFINYGTFSHMYSLMAKINF